jgi:hypothetical protein
VSAERRLVATHVFEANGNTMDGLAHQIAARRDDYELTARGYALLATKMSLPGGFGFGHFCTSSILPSMAARICAVLGLTLNSGSE